MTDIVERLRWIPGPANEYSRLAEEAADEIERLRENITPKEHIRLKQQNAELLAALQSILDREKLDHTNAYAVHAARAAIEKAKK